MHRNTYLLLILLAVAAAIVVGVNLTRKEGQETGNNKEEAVTPTPAEPPLYTFAGCGIAFPTPANHTVLEGVGNNVVFTGKSGEGAIIITCQKNIPRPAVSAENIETLAFELPDKPGATFAATLYHDKAEKLIFTHPTNGLDIFISGTGEPFEALVTSLSILR